MKKIKLILFVLLLQVLIVCPVMAELELSEELFTEELFYELADNINEIPYIETPDYHRMELDNGMLIYLAEDDKLPVVELRGYIKGGAGQESSDQTEISSIMSMLMTTGTENYSELELTRFKELNAVSINMSFSLDRYSFSGNSLSTEKDELIYIIAEILRNPEFEADYFNRVIQEYYQSISQQIYNDSFLRDMIFNTTLFGEHAYSNYYNINMIISSLQQMTPEKVLKFYEDNIDSANIVMAVSGDFKIEEMKNLIEECFADWESQGVELNSDKVKVNEENYNRVILVNKEDATHANVKMGYNFFDSSFEDRVPFMMANRIFGLGDFSSRLMENLRTQKGYVYGISSGMSYNDLGGLYYISTEIDPAHAYDAVEAIKEQILLIKEGEETITEDELFKNVNFYNAFFPQNYKEQINVVSDIVYDIEIRGKGDNPLNEFVSEYNALTAEEVQEAFEEYTYPERFLTVIVGRKDDILPVFEEQEIEVEVVDLF